MQEKISKPWISSYPDGVQWDSPMRSRPIYDMMRETREKFPHHPAFDFLGKKWTWAQIDDQVGRFAKGLQLNGVKKGMRVGIFLPNTPYYVIAYYALARIGAVIVNFNPLYAERELKHQIIDSGCEMMVLADLKMLYEKMIKMLDQTDLKKLIICPFPDILPFPKNILFKLFKSKDLSDIPYDLHHIHLADLLNNDGKPDSVPVHDDDLALLQYTGGTTGTPKGAMLSHKNIVSNTEQAILWFSNSKPGEEKMLGVIPFFHVFAMTAVMNFSVRLGFEIVALPRFELEATLKLIDKKKPQLFMGVPAIFNAINNHPKLKNFDLSSLRYCISGGAPLPVEVKKSFERNTGCVVVEGYGLTEASPIVCVNPLNGRVRDASIGLPLPGTSVEIINAEDKITPMPSGESGELCVRGPQVMQGYWNKPEETANVLKGGLLYTGDVAIMDKDGFVYIVDRIKDMIITNGYKVYPRNVEEAIYSHPDTEECIVAGIPDTDRGEIVKAWIKMKPGREISAEFLKNWLQDKLSPMELPKVIEFRDRPLPKTMIGKLSRKDVLAEEFFHK